MTFDRYLLRSFAHVFGACYTALFGLMVVIDLLENLDDFLARNGDAGTTALLLKIATFYGYQTAFFLDTAGPAIELIALVTVLILFQRSGELHPMLAAGVPMYRVLMPLVVAAGAVGGLLALNQELVIPKIAHAAYESRGGASASDLRVEPVYDHASRISIDGRRLKLSERTIEQAEFVLPAPTIAMDLIILKAPKAVHRAALGDRPAGWMLSQLPLRYDDIPLTEHGREYVQPGDAPNEVFVITAVTCDQLYRRNSSFTMLSSQELMRRIQSPAFGLTTVHQLVVHLHGRFVQPLINVIAALLVLPLMVRKESRGLGYDVAATFGAIAIFFGAAQGCQFLALAKYLSADLAAWLPVICGGSWAAWLSARIRS